MFDVEEPIDLDRVVFDLTYRRDVIEYLNRRAAGMSQRTTAWPSRGDHASAPASIRGGREAAIAVAQAKP